MAKVKLEIESDLGQAFAAFGQADELIDQTRHNVTGFGKDSKAAFSVATNEVDKFSTEVKAGTKQVNDLSKSTDAVGKSANRIKEIRNEIKQLTSDALKAGEGTKVFTDNLRRAGELKDELGDIQAAVSAVAGNTTENLGKAFAETTSLAARGFEAATAASALFGEENKEVEKTLLKLQAVQSLANITKEFGGLKDKLTEIRLAFTPVTSLFTNANKALLNFGETGGVTFKSVATSTGNFFKNFGSNMKDFAKQGVAGIKALGAAMDANPLGVILIVIAAVTAAFVLLRDKVKPIGDLFKAIGEFVDFLGEKLEDLGQAIGVVASDFEQAAQKQVDATKSVVDAINERYDGEIKLAQAAGKETIKIEKEKAAEQAKAVAKSIGALLALAQAQGGLNEEQTKQLAELRKQYLGFFTEINLINVRQQTESRKKQEEDNKKSLEAAKAAAEKRKQLQKDLFDQFLDLSKRAQQAELSLLNGEEKIRKQQEVNNKELDNLRKIIEAKGKLVDKNFKFNAEQEEQFAILQKAINQEAADALLQIEVNKSNAIAAQRKKDIDDEQKFLELKTRLAIAQVETAKNDTGLNEEDFEIAKQRVILQIKQKAAQDSANIKAQQIQTEANLLITQQQNEIAILHSKGDAESLIKAEQAQKNIEAIKRTSAAELEVLKAETAAQVEAIGEEINNIDKKVKPKGINLGKLMGLDDQQFSQLQGQIQQLTAALQDLSNTYFEIAQERLDQELEANEERIASRDSNLDSLKDRLAEEEELQRQGLANNVDRLNEEIAATEAARRADLEKEKKIKEEKKKLAKQQLIIDTALQASQLILAIAQLFAQGSSFWVGPVPVGMIIAGITATAMTASFIAGKAKAFQAVNSNSGFKKGGYTGDIGVDEVAGEVHGQEFVNTAGDTKKYRNLFEGIHEKDRFKMHEGILDLLKDTGIVLESELPTKLANKKDELRVLEYNTYNNFNTSGIETRVDKLTEEVVLMRKENKNKITTLPNGKVIEQKGNRTRVINVKP